MSSEQVAAVLRQSSMHGQQVKFIVARPVHNTVKDVDLMDGSEPSTQSSSSANPSSLPSNMLATLVNSDRNIVSNISDTNQFFLVRSSEIMVNRVNLL